MSFGLTVDRLGLCRCAGWLGILLISVLLDILCPLVGVMLELGLVVPSWLSRRCFRLSSKLGSVIVDIYTLLDLACPLRILHLIFDCCLYGGLLFPLFLLLLKPPGHLFRFVSHDRFVQFLLIMLLRGFAHSAFLSDQPLYQFLSADESLHRGALFADFT